MCINFACDHHIMSDRDPKIHYIYIFFVKHNISSFSCISDYFWLLEKFKNKGN